MSLEFDNENDYLQLVNQLQEKYNKYEKENRDIKTELYDIRKNLACIYGLVRGVDEFYTNTAEFENSEINEFLRFLLHQLRGTISGMVDVHVMVDVL
jgi:hypothetical protein